MWASWYGVLFGGLGLVLLLVGVAFGTGVAARLAAKEHNTPRAEGQRRT